MADKQQTDQPTQTQSEPVNQAGTNVPLKGQGETPHAMRIEEQTRQAAIDATRPQEGQEQVQEGQGKEQEQVDPQFSQQRLALEYARKEKDIRELKKQIKEMGATKEQYDRLVEALKDPDLRYKTVEEFGGNLSEWTDRIITGGQPQKSEQDIAFENLQKELSSVKEQLQQRTQQEQQYLQQQGMERTRQYAKKFVNEDNKDKYPITAALNQSDLLIYETQRRYKEGEDYSDEHNVAEHVEKRLFESLTNQLKSLSTVDKFHAILSELGYQKTGKPVATSESPQPAQTQQQGVRQESRTLTNDMSAEPSGRVDMRSIDDEYKKREIAAARVADIVAQHERNKGFLG